MKIEEEVKCLDLEVVGLLCALATSAHTLELKLHPIGRYRAGTAKFPAGNLPPTSDRHGVLHMKAGENS